MLRKILKFHKNEFWFCQLPTSVIHVGSFIFISKCGKVTEINHFDVKCCFLIYQRLQKAECHLLYFTRHNTIVITYAVYLHILSNTPFLTFYKNDQNILEGA